MAECVLFSGLGNEKEKNWFKCKRILSYYPQNVVQRAVQNVKNQVRIFVRNSTVWGDTIDVK
jgi:hypothetical protein